MEPFGGTMTGTPRPRTISTKRERIAQLAKQGPTMAFTSLSHHIDLDWLKEAYRRTRKGGAPGVDGQTAEEYAKNLEGNLRSLLNRAKSGTYRAPPVRRVHIPKGNGETRPLGIPTFEDKILQRAVVMLLEPIYEQDFLDCSYGFRAGRSAHQALEAHRESAMKMRGCWIVEVDLRKYFDTVDHGHLKELLRRRVRDGVVVRLIHKWLKAGVMEDGSLSYPESGTPQGGVISPLLSNVYLHYVLDEWFASDVKPRLHGRAYMVRYADDLVMGFASKSDADRVMAVLPKRCARYGLVLHPTKTRMVDYRQPRRSTDRSGPGRSGTFDFLGFTHYWGKSRRGNMVPRTKTMRKRLTRSVRKIAEWCRSNRHRSVAQQRRKLNEKLRGHYEYYGVTGNYRCLATFWYLVKRVWRKWLDRRDQQRHMPWARFNRLLLRYPLLTPRIAHSYHQRAANP